MIPDFDESGNLPAGKYEATIDEVIHHFGGSKSLKRSQLTKNLREFYNFIKHHATRIYIDGSYVSAKLSPGDVDLIVLFPQDFDPLSSAYRRFVKFQLEYKNLHLHIFSFKHGVDDDNLHKMINYFTMDRDGNPKGIIYIEAHDD